MNVFNEPPVTRRSCWILTGDTDLAKLWRRFTCPAPLVTGGLWSPTDSPWAASSPCQQPWCPASPQQCPVWGQGHLSCPEFSTTLLLLRPLWFRAVRSVCGFIALVFPHHCIRKNPNLTDENGKAPTRSQCDQNLALTACCANGRSAANSTRKHTHPWALLTAGSCREELVFAMLGTLPEASLVQTMVKSLGSGEEIPPNEFFPVVRYFFFSLADIRTISFANTCTSLQRKAWTYP